jgi:hypothetical protein
MNMILYRLLVWQIAYGHVAYSNFDYNSLEIRALLYSWKIFNILWHHNCEIAVMYLMVVILDSQLIHGIFLFVIHQRFC